MSNDKSLILERKMHRKKEEYKYFVGSTLKNSLEYEPGELIVFKIRPKFMDDYLDVPYVKYTLSAEHGEKKEELIKSSSDGWFYIETTIPESGFAFVKAWACDENGEAINDIDPYNGSAGADVRNLKRATQMPDDYMEFWESMKKRVADSEPEVLYSKQIDDRRYPDFATYDMRIKAPGSEYASFIVSYPKNAKPGELKFCMLFQGYGVNPATVHAKPGYLTVNVCAHAIPNGEPPEFYKELYSGALCKYGYKPEENESPETSYFAGMLLRNLAVLRFFENHELINKKDYYFVGSSQGGMQACNVAARFEKATAVILNVPWLSDVHGCELAGRHKNGMPKGRGITYFDTAVAAELVQCPVYIISGLGDQSCNSSTQMALYNSIKSQKYIEFYQSKTHSYTIPWDNRMYSLGDSSMKEMYSEHTAEYYDWN